MLILWGCGRVQDMTSDMKIAPSPTGIDTTKISPQDSTVAILDPNLEAALRLFLSYPSGNIMASQLQSLTTLTIRGAGIVSLNGLEACTALTELSVANNKISDISPLANLTSLQTLFLDDNQITDISPLTNLTSLTTLSFSDNNVANITALASLTHLRWLTMNSNQIHDITALSSLNSLHYVYMIDNQISDPIFSSMNYRIILNHETNRCTFGYM